MIRTKLTEMLGIEYPIVQGCMQWISRAPLVAAVSEAGGLGLLSSSTFSSADELQAEIRKIWAVDRTFEPQLDAKLRDARLHGWHRAVQRAFDWAKEE